MKTEFVATFQRNTKTADGWEADPSEQVKLDFDLIHPEKPETQIWDDAISVAWIRMGDCRKGIEFAHFSDHKERDGWQLVEIFALASDGNCLLQWSIKQPSGPRGTFDTWRDLTYSEMFNCEPLKYVKGGVQC